MRLLFGVGLALLLNEHFRFRRLIRSLPTRQGVLGVATCDKGLPAMMMALAGTPNLPTVLVPGGVTLPPERGEDADTEELLSKQKRPRDGKAVIPARGRASLNANGREEMLKIVVELDEEMRAAAADLNFELAARLRDEIGDLKKELRSMQAAGHA